MKLHVYGNDVGLMCNDIQKTNERIEQLKSKCSSILRYTIQALLSGPNAEFNSFVNRIKQDVESNTGPHKDDKYTDVIDAARTIYNNMDEAGEWNKVNPTDAKLLALTTKIEQLEKDKVALAAAAKSPPSNTANNDRNNDGRNSNLVGGVEKWRTIKKADTITVNGKDWHWCPHHKHPQGHFDGLYCAHKPEDHKDWVANKYKNRNRSNNQNSNQQQNGQDKKLTISARMKEVLCSRLMLSDEDADAICKEMNQSN